MGTTPQCRRKGLGAAVLHAALLDAKNMGLHYSLLFASDLGKLLYESCGFDVIEEWSFYKIRPRKEQSN
jgi:GNAT superfamily N-acetyltransferase